MVEVEYYKRRQEDGSDKKNRIKVKVIKNYTSLR